MTPAPAGTGEMISMPGSKKEWQHKFYLRRFENDGVRCSDLGVGDFEGLLPIG